MTWKMKLLTNKDEEFKFPVKVVPENTKFVKNEGKLVFKITKIDRVTLKEKKCITKARRIITKCEHASSKYYAKGMCKK